MVSWHAGPVVEPPADGQCRHWLSENLAGRDVVHAASNTRAAELAAADPEAAAIAPRAAAEIYDLHILAENIQDLSSNSTRFFVISLQPSARPIGRDRTAICFSIRDRVGALRDVVSLFADAGLNLSAIQSRPTRRRAWDYLFFVEIEGHDVNVGGVGRARRSGAGREARSRGREARHPVRIAPCSAGRHDTRHIGSRTGARRPTPSGGGVHARERSVRASCGRRAPVCGEARL